VKKFCKYLENPTKTGLWTLNLKWFEYRGISQYIIKKLKDIFDKQDYIEILRGKRKIKIKIDDIDREDVFTNIKSLSFIFELFLYLYCLEKKDEEFAYYYELGMEEKLIFDVIDLDEIKKKYKDAFNYFKENIYCEQIDPIVKDNKIIIIKTGFFIYSRDYQIPDVELLRLRSVHKNFNDKEYRKISLVSLDNAPLETIKTFYKKLNKIDDESILPVYSPEDEVFAPYFSFLEQAYEYFIDNINIKRLFKKSISEHNENNYSHCISTIGLITEDYLTQIYETLFREICPKGLTLGQLFDSIQRKISDRYERKLPMKPNPKPLYNNINDFIKKSDEKSKSPAINDLLKTIRDVITFCKDNKKHTDEIIESIQKKRETYSIFPSQLRENINELIKNRNAISHRSRVPIGNYEALRSIYCCITLILWWMNEKELIDWQKSQDEILDGVVKRNYQLVGR